jgi:23S rRNA pseudouridine2605 synthase
MVRHPRESGAKSRSGQAEKPKSSKDGKFSSKGAAPGKPLKSERVAKALARAGVASRREIERLINLGKVAVNGRILDTPAVLVTRDDILTVDGAVVNAPDATRIWRYHKPVGLMTTHNDPQNRPTVFQNLPEGMPRVISVGRLDLNSEGLLLLTNDGDLARQLEMPTNAWRRVYRVRALGHTSQEKLDTLMDGITVEDIHYGPIEATLDKAKDTKAGGGANVWITVALNEGKNREVRRVFEAIGLTVNRLIRLAYGPFLLGTLESGAVEEVGPRVIREQLAEFIAPENLPTGDKVMSPPAKPGRRPGASSRPIPANAIADPGRKPSRVRAQAARAEGGRPARPGVDLGFSPDRRKPTGDKPFRKGPPREARGEAGAKTYGDKPFRPKGPPRERAEGSERPYKARSPDRPDRPDRPAQGDRPYRARSPRPDGAPREGGDKRPYQARTPRPEGERSDRPERSGGFKGGDKPFRPNGPRAEGGPRGQASRPTASLPTASLPTASRPAVLDRARTGRDPTGPSPPDRRPPNRIRIVRGPSAHSPTVPDPPAAATRARAAGSRAQVSRAGPSRAARADQDRGRAGVRAGPSAE